MRRNCAGTARTGMVSTGPERLFYGLMGADPCGAEQSRPSSSFRWMVFAPTISSAVSPLTCSTSRGRDWCVVCFAIVATSAHSHTAPTARRVPPTRLPFTHFRQPLVDYVRFPLALPARPKLTSALLRTGLYPSSHGIVANDFYDPALDKEFVYTEPSKSWAPEWWGGEPVRCLWRPHRRSSAADPFSHIRSGLPPSRMACGLPYLCGLVCRSARQRRRLRGARMALATVPQLRLVFLAGPPKMLDGIKPTFFYPFINHYHYRKKINKLASWLDLPLTSRPHLITAYAPEVDQEGHRSGPHSHQVEQTLSSMDNFAKEVYELLEERNLTEIVDVIFVSDHGMTGELPSCTGKVFVELH